MKILFVTAGTQRAAATRYRVSQYVPLLKKKGIDCDVFSIMSDFMTRFMIKSPQMRGVTRLVYYALFLTERFLRSWIVILKSYRYERIFLQRVTFPLKLERALQKVNPNIIFDIDDAIYLPDIQGNDLLTRLKKFIKEGEVKGVLKVSKCVIVENEYIKAYVSQFCSNIYKIPGPIDTDRYLLKEERPACRQAGLPAGQAGKKKGIVIGWIGSPATTPYLGILDNVFIEVLEKYDYVSIHLIGAGDYSLQGKTIEKIPWSYDTEIEELQKLDIGLMSMPDNEWTRGKLGCKMLQYMALGIPTVASDTRTNREIIVNGVNGLLVKNEVEWINSIDKLIASALLRRTLGENARKTIEGKCSLKKNVVLLMDVLKAA